MLKNWMTNEQPQLQKKIQKKIKKNIQVDFIFFFFSIIIFYTGIQSCDTKFSASKTAIILTNNVISTN